MAAVYSNPTVTTTAAKLVENAADRWVDDAAAITFLLKNSGTTVIRLGGSTVTSSVGFPWDPAVDGKTLKVTLEPGEALWAAAASGSVALDVLKVGR